MPVEALWPLSGAAFLVVAYILNEKMLRASKRRYAEWEEHADALNRMVFDHIEKVAEMRTALEAARDTLSASGYPASHPTRVLIGNALEPGVCRHADLLAGSHHDH